MDIEIVSSFVSIMKQIVNFGFPNIAIFFIEVPDIVIGLGSYNIKVPSLVDKIEKRSRAKPPVREKDDFIIRFISKEVDDILNSLQ